MARPNLGSPIVSHDANGTSLPADWEDPDSGYLSVDFAHDQWINYMQYGDVVGDEFDVPGGDGVHPILGDTHNGSTGQFKYGASHYWDVSRQMEVTVNNPGLIPWSDFSEGLNDLYSNQQPTPQAASIPIHFPTDSVMGNDDVGRLSNSPSEPDQIATDEDNDPYVPRTAANDSLSHGLGEITSIDGPSSQIPNVAGVQDREYEELTHFREFVRLKLPSGWFRVSDPVDWRFEMKVKFSGGHWQDNGSFPAPTP